VSALEPPPADVVSELVRAALAEDRAAEDVSTLASVDSQFEGRAVFMAKADGVLAGIGVAFEVLRSLDERCAIVELATDGSPFSRGDKLGEVRGKVRAILQGERVALNFLQRLCGIATVTRAYVDAVAGTRAAILDTRKTTPLLRDLEKYAVRCGGGHNHRRDLASMAMLKDNHLAALSKSGRGMPVAVAAVRALRPDIAVEVEVDSLAQLGEALESGAEWVLLDNMGMADMREAVRRNAGRRLLEASGGITLASVREVAATGVDAISVGALTHSAPALDISLELEF
jgi:nicotinate-nucleotide pyrophosphorylase (carboxylating)